MNRAQCETPKAATTVVVVATGHRSESTAQALQLS